MSEHSPWRRIGRREGGYLSVSMPVGSASDHLAFGGRTVICLSTIDWNFLWQGHQEIMARFARAGNTVLFVENTGVRTIRFADLRRILHRLSNWSADRGGAARRPVPGVTLVAPILLPFPRSRAASWINERVLLPRLARVLLRLGGPDPVVFNFLPTPNAERLVDLLRGPRSVVVYYCIADFDEVSDIGPRLASSESRIASGADLVFVQSGAFGRRLSALNPRVHEFRFGVNLELFDPERVGQVGALAHLPHPIVGYSGGLHRHVDFGLLVELARATPNGSLVLVGPELAGETEAGALHAERNVHFLGAKPIAELPALVGSFDVGIVPYVRSAYTETVFPTKLYEYLAMGVPAVSTALPEVARLSLPRAALRIAHDTSSFIDLVREAARDGGAEARHERARLARDRDWSTIVRRMAELIAERASTK
jgi:glycosyltransferase involved in cell wall biosynthesis